MGRVLSALVKAGKWEGIRPVESRAEQSGSRFVLSAVGASNPSPSFQQTVCSEPRQLIHVTSLTLDRRLAAFWGNDQFAKERYQTLAVRLAALTTKRRQKSILVTSALPGEGKSTVAMNLAWLLAKPGEQRVLLLEANLRAPSLARMLGISTRKAWPAMLEGDADFATTAVRLDPNRLYILPSCQADYMTRLNGKGAGPAELVTSQRVEDLLSDLEEQFDVIIIDAPAINDFAETQRLATLADATTIVVRAGATNHAAVERAVGLVPKDRRLGIVLNDLDEEAQH